MTREWLEAIAWNEQGLVPVVTQDAISGQVLMLAWMNQDALVQTQLSGRATYWSRSRNRLWVKGESSGHVQEVVTIELDCDGDALLLEVRQVGGIACHTGRAHCFFRRLQQESWKEWVPVLKNPHEIYGTPLETKE